MKYFLKKIHPTSEKILFILLAFFLFLPVHSQTKIRSILMDGQNIFLGTNYGIYINQNDGFDWKLSNDGIPDGIDISEMVKHKTAVFGTDQTNGLYFSRDTGAFWKKADAFPRDFKKVNSLFSNDTSLFVVDQLKGIIYSSDEGLTWKPIHLLEWLNPNKSIQVDDKSDRKKKDKIQPEEKIIPEKTVSGMITCGSVILAGVTSKTTGGGIYKSSDNGQAWIEASFDLEDININRIRQYGNKIYVITAGMNGSVYCSENDGANWTKLSKAPIRWVTCFSANTNTLFVGTYYDRSSTSTDNGLTWKKMESLVLKKKQTVDHMEATNEGLYVGTSDGIIFMSKEKGEWTVKNEGLNTKKAGAFSYSTIGTQNGIALSANKQSDEIIFEVQNTTAKIVKVQIKVRFECEYTSDLGTVTLPKQEIDWLITVDANSTKSYDTNPEECAIVSCKNKTKSWEVVSWSVKE